ncbi:MAG: sporulation protein [Lachnospiraceae bacterium]|nr:sporulation protein [Lachnospiraceae bacterium]
MKKTKKPKLLEQKEHLADLFSLPHDIVCGACNVSIIGSMRVIIENYKGILEYNSEEIVLQGKQSKIKISGCCLKIRCYNEEEMIIDGRIDGVLFFD